MFLSVGEVEKTEAALSGVPANAQERINLLGAALRRLIAAVKHQETSSASKSSQALASQLLADSYYLQSRSKLREALAAARAAAAKSPHFGFGWVRLAELEFSFGHVREAETALQKQLNERVHVDRPFNLVFQNAPSKD